MSADVQLDVNRTGVLGGSAGVSFDKGWIKIGASRARPGEDGPRRDAHGRDPARAARRRSTTARPRTSSCCGSTRASGSARAGDDPRPRQAAPRRRGGPALLRLRDRRPGRRPAPPARSTPSSARSCAGSSARAFKVTRVRGWTSPEGKRELPAGTTAGRFPGNVPLSEQRAAKARDQAVDAVLDPARPVRDRRDAGGRDGREARPRRGRRRRAARARRGRAVHRRRGRARAGCRRERAAVTDTGDERPPPRRADLPVAAGVPTSRSSTTGSSRASRSRSRSTRSTRWPARSTSSRPPTGTGAAGSRSRPPSRRSASSASPARARGRTRGSGRSRPPASAGPACVLLRDRADEVAHLDRRRPRRRPGRRRRASSCGSRRRTA